MTGLLSMLHRVSSGVRVGARRDLHDALADPRRYEAQIDRLHERHALSRRLYELREGEVSLASVAAHRSTVARLLARAVDAGDYRFRPATLRSIRVEGRRRTVFAYPLADLLVHSVVAGILEDAVAPGLSPHLYSYRPGVPWWRGASDLAAYVRDHRRSRPDPRSRGLYVIRRDVDAYTDSIPVTTTSPVWGLLDGALHEAFPGQSRPADRDLVERVVRPEIDVVGGRPRRAERGVPTGQPVSCVLFNLYLRDLDTDLGSVPGAFYARYSDDIVFAHPDPAIAREAADRIAARLAALDLTLQPTKSSDRYLTGAGRASATWLAAAGTTRVTFLGFSISAGGTLALDGAKARRLLRDVRRRAMAVRRLGPAADGERLGRLVCTVLADALDPDSPATQEASAPLLAHAVTDRRQLLALDLEIARIAAAAIGGGTGVRAFRRVPYRQLREWGLPSLAHRRNRG